MHYYLSIDGKIISKPMTKEHAEKALGKLNGTIIGLEITVSEQKIVYMAAQKQKMKLVKRRIAKRCDR